jgi:hypothetical protein
LLHAQRRKAPPQPRGRRRGARLDEEHLLKRMDLPRWRLVRPRNTARYAPRRRLYQA